MVLAQREGLPAVAGPNVAVWQSVQVDVIARTLSKNEVEPNPQGYQHHAPLTRMQTPLLNPADLSPDLQEVVKLSQSRMSDDVTVNFIRNSGKAYKVTADDLIYLSSQGVSQRIINVLLQTASGAIPTMPDGTGGQIRISRGTDSFVDVSDSNKVVNVSPNTKLDGKVTLKVLNLGPGGAVAPLIYTPSWGDHSTNWRLINRWVPTGQSEQMAQLSIVAPATPGVYHIIFAVGWEIGGDHVASGTNWALRRNIWNDGNDLAEFNATQLASAQLNGWTTNGEMYGPDSSHSTTWYQPRYYPADAITLIVTGSSAPP